MAMPETLTELSIEEIEALYPDEWILVDVTELDGGEPLRGIVIDHGPQREPLWDRLERDGDDFNCSYIFFNGPIAPEDTVVVLWSIGSKFRLTDFQRSRFFVVRRLAAAFDQSPHPKDLWLTGRC
jgi:hypothetical protein